jgi:hypothetical protein
MRRIAREIASATDVWLPDGQTYQGVAWKFPAQKEQGIFISLQGKCGGLKLMTGAARL